MLIIRYLCLVDPHFDPSRFSPARDLDVVPGPFLEVFEPFRTSMDGSLGPGAIDTANVTTVPIVNGHLVALDRKSVV